MATIDASIVIIAMPAIFRGIGLNPLDPGNISYLLWMIIGYLLVQSVCVVTLGRLGDMFGRVRMYNLGFAVYTAASLMLTVTWMSGRTAAMYRPFPATIRRVSPLTMMGHRKPNSLMLAAISSIC